MGFWNPQCYSREGSGFLGYARPFQEKHRRPAISFGGDNAQPCVYGYTSYILAYQEKDGSHGVFFCVSVVFATGFLPEEKAVNQFQN